MQLMKASTLMHNHIAAINGRLRQAETAGMVVYHGKRSRRWKKDVKHY